MPDCLCDFDLSNARTACMLSAGPRVTSMASEKGITLYTAGTPNGWKANIIAEELEVPYKVHAIKLSDNVQKEDWFLKINPNGRIPAIGKTPDEWSDGCDHAWFCPQPHLKLQCSTARTASFCVHTFENLA